MELRTLRGEGLKLRPIEEGDLDRLMEIVTTPGVREWWGDTSDPEKLRRDLKSEDEGAFTIEVDGSIAGWLGVWEENEPEYRHGGVDIMLAPPFHGRGLGPRALRMAIRWLIDERGHHRVTIDPAAANERAIRAYESVGFRPVGVMRQYWRSPDGTWRDGLLMDLLADELRE
jgi:aminoglycoside 6'-N-acetyltransferase